MWTGSIFWTLTRIYDSTLLIGLPIDMYTSYVPVEVMKNKAQAERHTVATRKKLRVNNSASDNRTSAKSTFQ